MDADQLSRRERQIMRVIFRLESATVQQIHGELPDAPTLNAVRTMVQILEDKGFLRREKEGREFVYFPKETRRAAGLSELRQVLETFFEDSIEQALATHLTQRNARISSKEYERLAVLIEAARQEEEKGGSGRKKKSNPKT